MTPLTTNNQLLTQLERLVIDHFGFHPQAPTFPFLVQKGIFLPTMNGSLKPIHLRLSYYSITTWPKTKKKNQMVKTTIRTLFTLQIDSLSLTIYKQKEDPCYYQEITHFSNKPQDFTYTVEDIPLEELFQELLQKVNQ